MLNGRQPFVIELAFISHHSHLAKVALCIGHGVSKIRFKIVLKVESDDTILESDQEKKHTVHELTDFKWRVQKRRACFILIRNSAFIFTRNKNLKMRKKRKK